MRIGVIGGGVVGHATARCFMEWGDVWVYDVIRERATHTLDEVLLCDLIFVCLPTPQKVDGWECNTSIVERFFADVVRNYGGDGLSINFVLRSTVPIGFTRSMREKYGLKNLVHSPEFLTARCAVTDAQMPARNIIGVTNSPNGSPHQVDIVLRDLYERRFPGVSTHIMFSDESEAVKLMQNSFFAVKVAFFNEIKVLADRLGLDWERVRSAILADGRIAHSHTQVPGPDGLPGFGGACLPKDLANLISCMREQLDVPSWVTEAAFNWSRLDN